MSSTVRIAGLAFGLTAAVILGAATGVTFLIGAGGPEWLRIPFRLLCHGLESRSFVLGHVAMPLCARCAGIYVGMIGGIGVGWLAVKRGLAITGWVALLAVIPMALDGGTQALLLRESTNGLRVLTGLVAGTGTLAWVMTLLAEPIGKRTAVESDLQC